RSLWVEAPWQCCPCRCPENLQPKLVEPRWVAVRWFQLPMPTGGIVSVRTRLPPALRHPQSACSWQEAPRLPSWQHSLARRASRSRLEDGREEQRTHRSEGLSGSRSLPRREFCRFLVSVEGSAIHKTTSLLSMPQPLGSA